MPSAHEPFDLESIALTLVGLIVIVKSSYEEKNYDSYFNQSLVLD